MDGSWVLRTQPDQITSPCPAGVKITPVSHGCNFSSVYSRLSRRRNSDYRPNKKQLNPLILFRTF